MIIFKSEIKNKDIKNDNHCVRLDLEQHENNAKVIVKDDSIIQDKKKLVEELVETKIHRSDFKEKVNKSEVNAFSLGGDQRALKNHRHFKQLAPKYHIGKQYGYGNTIFFGHIKEFITPASFKIPEKVPIDKPKKLNAPFSVLWAGQFRKVAVHNNLNLTSLSFHMENRDEKNIIGKREAKLNDKNYFVHDFKEEDKYWLWQYDYIKIVWESSPHTEQYIKIINPLNNETEFSEELLVGTAKKILNDLNDKKNRTNKKSKKKPKKSNKKKLKQIPRFVKCGHIIYIGDFARMVAEFLYNNSQNSPIKFIKCYKMDYDLNIENCTNNKFKDYKSILDEIIENTKKSKFIPIERKVQIGKNKIVKHYDFSNCVVALCRLLIDKKEMVFDSRILTGD